MPVELLRRDRYRTLRNKYVNGCQSKHLQLFHLQFTLDVSVLHFIKWEMGNGQWGNGQFFLIPTQWWPVVWNLYRKQPG